MNKWIQKVDAPRLEELKSENRSSINIGDTVRVGVQIREGDRTRVQNYQGTVIRQHNNGVNSTITVRRIFQGIGIERIFPLYSRAIVKIEVLAQGKVRRAKLNFLRNKKGKAARLKAKS
uniref:Large ribosomal subunit protein bL19c n=1 Tax=Chloropicon mariensis TaxID=1606511 RepID=A0A4D6C1Z9_9CHLO|nr:ribosomal protein L19 [Chloropicon mariensis]QBX97856.1 ribosomal protein L19 [Chloropicon mariensis]UQK95283.1 ribosomal protein L19 [Chloropicon mariensis]